MAEGQGSKLKKHRTPFKSPFQDVGARASRPGSAQLTTDQLREKLQQITQEIDHLRTKGYQESELKVHIDKLHEYNELRDIAQMVLGQLATVRGVCVKDLYSEYGLDLND